MAADRAADVPTKIRVFCGSRDRFRQAPADVVRASATRAIGSCGSICDRLRVKPKRLVAIRPYDERIRGRVFGVLERLGYERAQMVVFAARTPDQDVLAGLADTPTPDAMLVPFHAHHDTAGRAVDGLTTLLEARTRLPTLARVPVMMPVSQVVLAALQLRLAKLDDAQRRGIHVVEESELDDPARVAERLRAGGM
jgi:hypothetical protein